MGAARGPQTPRCNCNIQEAIDKYESKYNEIINSNLSDKKLDIELTYYAESLNRFIGRGMYREDIKNLTSGKFSVKVVTTANRDFYSLVVKERKENENIGITQEQIIKLQKFVEYLEQEDTIIRLKKSERKQGCGALIFTLIIGYILAFVLYKNHPILKIIVILFAVILLILEVIGILDITVFLKNNKK
ncbi:hypothetical protein [Clostridium massiliamazoniense]|uniref:hypothetical protein n=1 Tax=Clostridium massiliamazoniense TaxID=1347366 RepID=UPI0006D7FEE6|nr:hypothetical protein [Clostridium massiliamazoniense]